MSDNSHEQRCRNTLARNIADEEIKPIVTHKEIEDITTDLLCSPLHSVDINILTSREGREYLEEHTLLNLCCDMEITLHIGFLLCRSTQVFNISCQFLLHRDKGITQMRYIRMSFHLRQLSVEFSLSNSICSICYLAKRAQLPVYGYHNSQYDNKEQQKKRKDRYARHSLEEHGIVTQRHIAYHSPSCSLNIGISTTKHEFLNVRIYLQRYILAIVFKVRRIVLCVFHYPVTISIIYIDIITCYDRNLCPTLMPDFPARKFIKPIEPNICTKR